VYLWYYKQNELWHYGIKGMKWHVRRTKEELKYNRNSIKATLNNKLVGATAKNGLTVTRISRHIKEQARARKVGANEIIDAFKNPLFIESEKIDNKGRRSQRFIGKKAIVNVNPDSGTVITVWKNDN